jgi:hypothetical protein
LCFHILATDTHRIIERSVLRSAERSTAVATLRFPIDTLTPTFEIDPEARQVFRHQGESLKIDEKVHTDENHQEMGEKEATVEPIVVVEDEEIVSVDTPVIRTNNRHENRNGERHYQLRSCRRQQRYRHQRPRQARLARELGPETALLHIYTTMFPDLLDAKPVSITDTPDYQRVVRNLNAKRQKQLKYVVTMDMLMDQHDVEHETWYTVKVINHSIVLQP